MSFSPSQIEIWLPGDQNWELWSTTSQRDGLTLQDSLPPTTRYSDLPFSDQKGKKVLAIPTAMCVSTTFVSKAADEERLVKEVDRYLSDQSEHKGKSQEAGIQPIGGPIGKTLTRIDLPKQSIVFRKKIRPNLIVPAASLYPLQSRQVSIWRELGQMVAGFGRNGLAVDYSTAAKGTTKVDFIREIRTRSKTLFLEEKIEPLRDTRLWSDESPRQYSRILKNPVHVESRPAPALIHYQVGLNQEINKIKKQRAKQIKKTSRSLFVMSTVWLGLLVGLLCLFGAMKSRIAWDSIQKKVLEKNVNASNVYIARCQQIEKSNLSDKVELHRYLKLIGDINTIDYESLKISDGMIHLVGFVNSASESEELLSDLRRHPALSSYRWNLTRSWETNIISFSIEGNLKNGENDTNTFVTKTKSYR